MSTDQSYTRDGRKFPSFQNFFKYLFRSACHILQQSFNKICLQDKDITNLFIMFASFFAYISPHMPDIYLAESESNLYGWFENIYWPLFNCSAKDNKIFNNHSLLRKR